MWEKNDKRSISDTTVAWSLLFQVSILSGPSLGVEFDLKIALFSIISNSSRPI